MYYTKIRGKQIRLSDNEDEAKEKFARLQRADLPGDTSRAEEICDDFLEFIEKNPSKTYRTCRHFLNSFCNCHGSVLVCELARRHATKWLEKQDTWNPSTRAYAGSMLKICFRWAVDEGMVSENPFVTLKKIGELKRERVPTPRGMAGADRTGPRTLQDLPQGRRQCDGQQQWPRLRNRLCL